MHGVYRDIMNCPGYPILVTAPPELERVGPCGGAPLELLREIDGETTPPADPGRLLLRGRPPDRCVLDSSCDEWCRR